MSQWGIPSLIAWKILIQWHSSFSFNNSYLGSGLNTTPYDKSHLKKENSNKQAMERIGGLKKFHFIPEILKLTSWNGCDFGSFRVESAVRKKGMNR
jgi:hypothetical protein